MRRSIPFIALMLVAATSQATFQPPAPGPVLHLDEVISSFVSDRDQPSPLHLAQPGGPPFGPGGGPGYRPPPSREPPPPPREPPPPPREPPEPPRPAGIIPQLLPLFIPPPRP